MKIAPQKSRYLFLSYLIVFLSVFTFLSSCSTLNYSKSLKSRKMILRDEGLSQLNYVDLDDPKKDWCMPVPAGRDLQLVGNKRVLIGTGNGYEERDVVKGNKVSEMTLFPGTQTARRLRNGNTLLAGADWQGKKGIVLVEVDSQGIVKRSIVYPGFNYVRCIRETVKGTFMVTADDTVFEGAADGKIIWQAKVLSTVAKPHIWQAVRLANGQTIVSTGYGKNFQVFAANGTLVKTFSGPAEVKPNFFAGFQVLKNGNYVVTNWQGHGPKFGASGNQLLEFSPDGKLAWSWKQDPTRFSSLQGVMVLDGLDVEKLHVENERGALEEVK